MLPEKSALQMTVSDTESVADEAVSEDFGSNGRTAVEREPFGRFRRGIGRFRGDADTHANGNSVDDDRDLKLEVMLLREENARLKVGRHRASDIGTMIDQFRLLAADKGEPEMLDEAWTVLTECAVIREGLEQACNEIETAISAVHRRLRRLAVKFDGAALDGHPTGGGLDGHSNVAGLNEYVNRAGNRDGDCRIERAIPHLADTPATLDSAS